MPSNFGEEFDCAVKHFRKNFAPNCGLPVRVRSVKGHTKKYREHAVCLFWPGKCWKIVIDSNESAPIDQLIHEWAHILHDEKHGHVDDHSKQHSDEWGIIYARLYRAYWEDNEERENEETN